MFDNDDKFKRSPIKQVRPATRLHYTITPIGGAKDLEAWKAQKIVDEVKWQEAQTVGRADRRANAMAVVSGTKPAMPVSFEEKRELLFLNRKRALPENRRSEYLPYQPVIIRKSFISKVTSWIFQTLFN